LSFCLFFWFLFFLAFGTSSKLIFFLISSFNIRLTRNWVLWFFFKGVISISLPGSWAWNANPSWHQNFYLDFFKSIFIFSFKNQDPI
jgi:hypothetical protein